jgi:hypothetical protein
MSSRTDLYHSKTSLRLNTYTSHPDCKYNAGTLTIPMWDSLNDTRLLKNRL